MNEYTPVERLMDFLASEEYRQNPDSLQTFLENNPACQPLWEEMREGWELLQDSAPVQPDMQRSWQEIVAAQPKKKEARTISFTLPRWTVAAACGIIGLTIGLMWPQAQPAQADPAVAALVEELRETRQAMQVLLLQSPNVSERMKAVSLSRELPSTPSTHSAWIRALESDPSVNVRMAALDVLSREPVSEETRQQVIAAMPFQQAPMMRMAMADVVLAWESEEAVEVLNRWINDPASPPQLIDYLQNVVNQFSENRQKPRI